MTTTDEVFDALHEAIAEQPAPVATAPEVAERLPVTRRTVLSRLNELEAAGEIGSRDVGRHRVFWPSREPPAEPGAEPSREPRSEPPGEKRVTTSDRLRTVRGAGEAPAEPPGDPPAEKLSDAGNKSVPTVAEIVERASDGWEGAVDERRAAARAALEWLQQRDDWVTRSDVVDALEESHGVDGQNARTWWRRTVRPAFQEAVDADLVEFQDGLHRYRWDP